MKIIMDTIMMKTMITVFDANRVISEDEQGFVMSHGDHNHYFFKKDLTAEQIKAAQDHLKTHHDVEPVKPLAKTVESFSRDASDEEKIAIFRRHTAFHLKRLEFQTDSLSLEIQTKPTIQLISIPMLFVRNMFGFLFKLAIQNLIS